MCKISEKRRRIVINLDDYKKQCRKSTDMSVFMLRKSEIEMKNML